jgi:hypothetical protein
LAFFQKLRPGGPVNGAIHSAAAQQRIVGGVNNGVHFLLSNVSLDNSDPLLYHIGLS